MADKGHLYADRKLEEIERELTALYGRTEAEIEETASRYFAQLERLDKQKRVLVEEGRLTEEEYKTWRKNKLMYGKRFTAMKEECAKQLLNVNGTALEYVSAELANIYAVNYNQFAKQAMKAVKGYSFTLLNADTVRHMALNDKSLLPYKKLDAAKDIPWNMKKINSEVLQGILQGESTDKIAKRISRVQEMNRTAAVRTARTLVTEAECKGRQDSYVKAADDGIILERKWIAAHDARTRHWHADLDGKTAKTDEPFENAYGKIMYPGDRTAHPANVYNCRCTIAAVVKGFGKTEKISEISFDGNIQYEKSETDLTNEQKGDKIGDSTAVISQNTPTGSDLFSDEQKKTLLRAEKMNNNNKYETAYVFDANGNIKFKMKGTADEVKFTSQQIKDMKGCVITHNHPSNSTFSSSDINMLRRSGASEIRASTSYGTYVLQAPQKWDKALGGYDSINKIYNSYFDDYILRYKDRAAQEGKHLLYYYQAAEEDATRAFAEKYGLKFKLEKVDAKDLQFKTKK